MQVFMLVGASIGVVASMLRGGRLRHAGSVDVALPWLLLVGAVVGVLVGRVGPGGPAAGDHVLLVLLAEQAAILAFVTANAVAPGMVVVGCGAVLNAIAVLANRGMPVLGSAIDALGGDPATQPFRGSHHLAGDATLLPMLVDRLPVPGLRSVVSVGDLVVVVGLVLVIDHLLRPRAP